VATRLGGRATLTEKLDGLGRFSYEYARSALFKGITNLAGLLKQAQQVGSRLQQVNDELKNRRTTGRAGGGMVEVEVNGLGQVLRLSIDPALVEMKDRELLEDLIPAATNQALTKAKELHAEVIKDLAGGMNIPGLDEALAKATGQEPTTDDE
jgi:DNA-binding YbaB/EbfC family protein